MEYGLEEISRVAHEARRSFNGGGSRWESLDKDAKHRQIKNVENALENGVHLGQINFYGEPDFDSLSQKGRIGRLIFVNVARTLSFTRLIIHPKDALIPEVKPSELCVSEAHMYFGNITTLNIYHGPQEPDE